MFFRANGTVEQFEELNLTSKIRTDSLSQTSLRGNISEKARFARRVWDITINTQSIQSDDDLAFLELFFYSSDRAISLTGIESEYRKVYTAPGDFPVEFLESCKLLPQVKFSLTSKKADITKLIGESFFFL